VGITFVFVTHDQDEAMALSTRIAVMNRGQVIQVGTPSEIYEFPQSRFVADFIGTTNLFEGTVRTSDAGHLVVRSPEAGCDLVVDEIGRFSSGQRVWVALRPEKIRLSKQPVPGGWLGEHQSNQGHSLGTRVSRQSLHLSDQDRNRQGGHGFRPERPPHVRMVHRLE
jgi:putrescine transport system ATP-binding protein